MPRTIPSLALAVALGFAGAALASPPPPDALPLSQIVQSLEQQGNVHYIDEIDWDDDGYWEIEYITRDGAKVKVKIDPVSGEIRR